MAILTEVPGVLLGGWSVFIHDGLEAKELESEATAEAKREDGKVADEGETASGMAWYCSLSEARSAAGRPHVASMRPGNVGRQIHWPRSRRR